MNKKRQTVHTYNTSATGLARKFDAMGARILDIEKVFSYIKKTNPYVIEIGCGNGRDAQEILKRTTEYSGFDISEELIKIAKTNVPEGIFEVHDVETYVFPDNTDIIFSSASLLHSDEEVVKNVLTRAHISLQKDGVFFISLKYGEYREFTKKDEFGKRTYYLYTPEKIKELAGDSYTVLHTDTQELRGQKWFTIILKK